MLMPSSGWLVVAVASSLAAAPLIVAFRRRPNLREACTFAAGALKLVAVAALLPGALAGEQVEVRLFTLLEGADLVLRADPAGTVFALLAAALWLVTSVFSVGYMRSLDEQGQARYYACFAVALSCTMGLAFSANLVSFFVFYELLTLATWPLVNHARTPAARAAGRRYLAYLLGGGAVLLLAVILVHLDSPGGAFEPGGSWGPGAPAATVAAAALLFTVGLGTKAAVMPLHAWLPAAMVAPTPVSALLHAVAVVKAGVFGFVRAIGYLIGPERLQEVGAATAIVALAGATVVVASLVALGQDNLKRRLAYSTIAHLSLIVLGLALAQTAAWEGSLLHIANHAAAKITLFFCAGALYAHAHVERVSDLDGMGRQMPLTMGAFAFGSLALAGVPPFGGFVSKWFLGLGAVHAGQAGAAVVVLGSGLLTAGYLLPVVVRAFVRPPGAAAAQVRGEARLSLVAPLALTAAAALALGLGDLAGFGRLAEASARAVMGPGP